ncbi:MAG: glycosyltransferase family 87 protein [Gemmataceae bacterium]
MLKRHEHIIRWSTITLAVLFAGFGAITLVRSAFQHTRKTDLTVYLRAAWAVRTGEDPYTVADEHGWHYHYPPLVASLLTPLAQPPADSKETAWVPFPTVVVFWYLLGVTCVLVSLHCMSKTVGSQGLFREGKYRFWLNHVPLWVLLPTLGGSLGRGQINEWVLLLIVAMIASALIGQRFLAGVCLAGAACIKLIPIFLIVYPLWKRDSKWLAGTVTGLILGLMILPAAMIGPQRTFTAYKQMTNRILHPALLDGPAGERDHELLGMTATDNQSIQGTIHNIRHFDRTTRPTIADPTTRVIHWLIGGLLTIVTVVVGARSTLKEPHREALAISALIVPMLLISPVCHMHYFVLLLPLIVALIGSHLANSQRVRPGLTALLAVNFLTAMFPRLPGCESLRDVGLMSLGALGLWFAALVELGGEAVQKIRLPGVDYAKEVKRKWAAQHSGHVRPPQVDHLPGNG